jgi:hypothetical protein
MGLIKRLASPVAALMVGAAALYVPQIIYSQDNGELNVNVNKLSKEEAKSRLSEIAIEVSRFPSGNNFLEEFNGIYKDISYVLDNADDRDRRNLYDANFLRARLIFGRDDRTFSGAFDSLEQCIIKYPEQEKQFGLAYNALRKIGDRFSKERKLVGLSLCNELAGFSKYPRKDLSQLRANLDRMLNRNIGGLTLRQALGEMFGGEDSNMRMSVNYYLDFMIPELKKVPVMYSDGSIEMEYAPPVKNSRLVRKLEKVVFEVEPGCRFNPIYGKRKFPKIILKDVEVSKKGENPNALLVCETSAGTDFLLVRKGTRIKDFLKMAGIDPYHWFYKGAVSKTDSLKDMEW